MNFGELSDSVLNDLFVEGRPENLEIAHQKQMIQAVVDLQNKVSCLRYANTDFYPQCATYFNCGMTVVPQPFGQVLRVYAIGKKKSAGSASAGTVIGSVTANPQLLQFLNGALVTIPLSGSVCDIETDGVYTVTVNQSNPQSTLFPANSPQYFITEILYTDLDGNAQSAQPADLMHINNAQKNGALAIECKGGTSITYNITPFNQPETDGGIVVAISVTAGSLLSDSDDWCAKVYYHQVEYAHIERYVRACNNCSGNDSWWAVANALVANLCGAWRVKRTYNPPTDLGFENLPPLPHGFHYPQTSTDAGGRSRGGVYAVKHGRIYIAPWIESTESLVVEWNGIKTNWAPEDLVSDDPLFLKAVRLNVAIQHYTHYEDNLSRLAEFKKQYAGEPGIPGVLRQLIIQCRDRNRQRTNDELGATDGDAAIGGMISSGMASNSAIYYNTAQAYTATCPSGQAGSPVKITIPAGQYSSSLSVADANAAALAAAQYQAQAALSCSSASVFYNVEKQSTASCAAASGDTPAASGNPVSVTIPAQTYQSTISQELVDQLAQNAADASAQQQLSCTFHNAPQTVQVTCGDNTTQSVTIPANQPAYDSTVSQDDSNSKAQIAATNQATAACPANAGFTVCSTPHQQTVIIPTAVCTSRRLIYNNVPYTAIVQPICGQATSQTESTVLAALNAQAVQLLAAQIAALQAQVLARNQQLASICGAF